MSDEKVEDLDIENRRKKILEMLNKEGKVKVVVLSKIFGISEVTARGDLDVLEESGLLERIHGGAVSTYKTYFNMTFRDRLGTNKDEKKRIAVEAASMIADGDTIMLGSGTTPLFVLKELKDKKNLVIVTNSLPVVQEASYSNINHVILLGGNVNLQYQFTYGDDTINQLKKYKADKLLISSDGISAEFGLTTYHHLEAEMSRQMIECVNKTIAIADYTKIGRASFSHIESIDKIDCLISNKNANKDEIEAIKDKGTEIRLI